MQSCHWKYKYYCYNNYLMSISTEPPVIHQFPSNLYFREPPSHAIFEISASGTPTPIFKWFYNSKEITFSNKNNK